MTAEFEALLKAEIKLKKEQEELLDEFYRQLHAQVVALVTVLNDKARVKNWQTPEYKRGLLYPLETITKRLEAIKGIPSLSGIADNLLDRVHTLMGLVEKNIPPQRFVPQFQYVGNDLVKLEQELLKKKKIIQEDELREEDAFLKKASYG
jgi:hypothetical protein